MIKALIFDLDDTLYYEKEYVLGGFKEVCSYLSMKYCIDSKELYDKCEKILSTYGRGKIFNILCSEYNLKEDVLNLVEIYRNSKPELDLYEDSKYILALAEQRKINLGIITDGCAKVQWNKIKSLNLETIVDKIIVTDDYGEGFGKPNKRSYIDIMNYFNVIGNECIYIGDNPKKDFIGAKELGFKTIRIIREQGDHILDKVDKEYEADFIINDLKRIEKLLF